MITAFEFILETPAHLPPPFSHTYCLKGQVQEDFLLEYELFYTGREQLSDEEIFEEGFTKEDDIRCQGKMPAIWKDTMLELLQNTTPNTETVLEQDHQVALKITNHQGEVKTFRPNHAEHWEQTMQEMVQGLLEAQRIERPLTLQFKKQSKSESHHININIQFAEKKIILKTHHPQMKPQVISNDWEMARKLMQLTFNQEFDIEKASKREPKSFGFFINLGDEFWFRANESVFTISETKNTLKTLEDFVMQLYTFWEK